MNSFEIIAYPLLLISAMELILGFLLLTQNRQSSPVRRSVAAIAFFSAAYSLNTAVMYLTASRGLDFNLFARLNWIGWFAVPAGLQFLFYFRSESSRQARIAGYVFYPYWGVVLALCLFTDLIVTPGYSLIPFRNEPGPLEIPARAAGALMTVWLIFDILRFRRELTGLKKFQLNHFLYGLLIFAFAGVVIAGIMPAIRSVAVEPGLGAFFSLPWVLFTFYAIVRHSLFETRIIFSRTLAAVILILVCSGMQLLVLTAVAPGLGTTLAIPVSLSLLGFFLFGTPVRRNIQALVDALIVGDRYNYETLMREAMVTLNAKKETDELTDHVIEMASAGLHIEDAGIYLHRIEDGFVLRQGRGRFLPEKNRGFLADIAVKKLQETSQSLILGEIVGEQEDDDTFHLTTYLRTIGAEALVPLLFQGRLQGALILGRKPGGEAFGQSDVRFLETLAAHAASALENARLTDITRRIRSSLQESEQRFIALARELPAAVFIHRENSIVYANTAAEEITGYPGCRLTKMSMADLVHPESQGQVALDSAESMEPRPHRAGKEVRVMHANGTQRWAVMTSAVMEYGEQAALIGILFDITDQKRTEGELRYERIRDAAGRMASYLAGDLERLAKDLGSISTFLEYGEEGEALAGRITSAAKQAEFLVRNVREFGSRPELKRTLQDIGALVAKRQRILEAMLTGKCMLVLQPAQEPLAVMADAARIESALMNLVLYARDRLQRGGTITITTGRAAIDRDFILRTGYGQVGMYATISVSDTGQELTAAEQERIFEPFFTTQEGWQGNGRGLSAVYDIIKDHEGYVTVTNRPGEGVSFKIFLPLKEWPSRPRLFP